MALPAVSKRFVSEIASIASLRPSPNNARTHSKRQVQQIARSIREFGPTNPIVVDPTGEIIAGHGRWLAAQQIGLHAFPVMRVFGLTERQKSAIRLADNKIAANAGWNLEILAAELEGLTNVEFDATITGFSVAEIDLLIDQAATLTANAKADMVAEPRRESPAVSRLGDIWRCGEHRILCGDACSQASYLAVLKGERAQMVFTDPPYNVRMSGHAGGLGTIQHREFAMASGEMSTEEYRGFLRDFLRCVAASSVDGSIHFVCMDWRHTPDLLYAAHEANLAWKNLCVWKKAAIGMGTFYRSQHELVFVLKNGDRPHINNFELGQHGRTRTNVWEYSAADAPDVTRHEALSMHPTVKPAALVADAMKDCSTRGGIILDPFGGSGTSMIAAEMTGRCGRLIELDPHYVDAAVRRWEGYSGGEAIHATTDQTFAEVSSDRAAATRPDGTEGA